MICHERKLIFIHIPKCAGTSIETALGFNKRYSGRRAQDHRTIRMLEPFDFTASLSSYDNMKAAYDRFRRRLNPSPNPESNITVTADQYAVYKKVAVVRNPWSRAFSWYQNAMRDDVHRARLNLSSDCSFDEFLASHAGKGALRPQFYWLLNYRGQMPIDLVIRFENLQSGFQELKNSLGERKLDLPHALPGGSKDYREAYTSVTRELVSKVYDKEIAAFGYSFE